MSEAIRPNAEPELPSSVEMPGQATQEARPSKRKAKEAVGGFWYDLVMALFSMLMVLGVYLDGWAHNNGRVDFTFFTPWHALLYGAMFVTGIFLSMTLIRNVMKGYHWRRALPQGYMLSFLGVIIFAFGGVLDMTWHEIFGFEESVEALLSPTHLIIGASAVLILAGPLRASWRRAQEEKQEGWTNLLPAVLSLLAILSTLTFFTQFANAYGNPGLYTGIGPGFASYSWDVTGVTAVLLPAALTMSIILLGMSRWTLPIGSLTLIITVNSALMFFMLINQNREFRPVLLAALAAGLLADTLLILMRPSARRLTALRIFAFVTPFTLFFFYFIVLILIDSIWWSIHLWLGAAVMAGFTGLGLSYLSKSPPTPTL